MKTINRIGLVIITVICCMLFGLGWEIVRGLDMGVLLIGTTAALILFLSFGILVAFFGFLNGKNMRGRWLSGGIQILIVLLALFEPLFQVGLRSSGEGLIILLILAGAASVLFSRTLAYTIKPIKDEATKWVLTTLSIVFGPIVFLLSIAVIFRSVSGEGVMAIEILAFYEAGAVFFVSLFVNIITVRQRLDRSVYDRNR